MWLNILFFSTVLSVIFFIWKQRKWIIMQIRLRNGELWNIPVLGNAYLLVKDDEAIMNFLQHFARIATKQGGLTSVWMGPKYYVLVADAKASEFVLNTFLGKSDTMNMVRELFGNGSIFAPLEIWRPRRKVIAPTFSLKNLNQFVDVFSQQSNTMVEQLREVVGKGTVSMWNFLTTYSMDSVCESTLGVKVYAQRNPDHPFLDAFDQHCKMAAVRILQPPVVHKAYKFFPIYKLYMKHIYTMWDFVDSIIKNKRKELLEQDQKQWNSNNNDIENPLNTFLELFIQSSGGASGFTDMELREETLVLLLAGTDTSAVGLAFTCLMLARHPDVQEKLYDEIKEVLGDSKEPITVTTLHKLKYVEAVLKESLRLYPPVSMIIRTVDKDCQMPSGITIVKGTDIVISIWGVHRNPEYWGDDADEFRPERFIGSTLTHPAAFIPFSHGPRSCLGYQYAMMSMKTAVANIVRNFRLLPATPVQDKNAPLRVKFAIMMKHVDNFELQLQSRT